jgi:hypothetical protein
VIASRPIAALPIGARPAAGSIIGVLAVTDGTDVYSLTGVVNSGAVTSTLAVINGADTLLLAGTVALAGTLSVTDGTDVFSLAGVVDSGVITGTLAYTDGADTFSVSGSTPGATVELLGGGPGGPKRKGRPEKGSYWERLLSPPLQDRLEAIEPEAAEVIEAVAQVAVAVDRAAQEAEMRRALQQAGIAYREAYVEIYTELLAEMRRQQDDEDEVLLLMMA